MARTRNPERKPALLVEIVDFLLDKPLATLSFRTVAEGLGVSTYTLVYHFGTRAELIREIVKAISDRQDAVVSAVAEGPGDMDTHLDNIRRSWMLVLNSRSRQLQRLEFEAAMLEVHENPDRSTSVRVFDLWLATGVEALVRMGLSRADAELEARLLVDTIYGLQYDLIVTRDTQRATATFERAVENYEKQIRGLLAATVSDEVSGGLVG